MYGLFNYIHWEKVTKSIVAIYPHLNRKYNVFCFSASVIVTRPASLFDLMLLYPQDSFWNVFIYHC